MNKHDLLFLTLLSLSLIYVLPGKAEISTVDQTHLNTAEREVLLVNQLNRATVEDINQLRCWQQGRLIVDEINVTPVSTKGIGFSNQKGNRLNTYDFGETFCLYTGD